MRRISRFEKNVFFVLFLICPGIVGGALSQRVGGNVIAYILAAIVGAVIWRVWILIRDRPPN